MAITINIMQDPYAENDSSYDVNLSGDCVLRDPATDTKHMAQFRLAGTLIVGLGGGGVASSLLTSLVGYWKFEEASGSRADSSGLGNTLVENAATVNSAGGKIGQGANIVRTDLKYLRCASNANLQMGDVDFTIAFWANFTSFTATAGTLVDKDNGSAWEYDIYASNAAKFGIYVERGAANASAEHTTTLAASTWYFLVAIHDSVNDQIKVSINNGAFATTAFAGGTAAGTGNFNIGNITNGDLANACNGVMDEVGIWKRVLSAGEITTLYNGGAGITYPF